jgi:hypothetical protein
MEHRISSNSSNRKVSSVKVSGPVTNSEFCSMSNGARAKAANASSSLNGKVHPLRSLMDSWEREGLDEEESDSDLTWLSRMIDQQFFGLKRD